MSRVNFLNNLASTPVKYNLGAGVPPLDLYPKFDTAASINVFKSNFPAVDLLQYHKTEGLICDIAIETLKQNEKINTSLTNTLITNGVQEAIFLTLLVFKDKPIYCLDPFYPGIVDAATKINCKLHLVDHEQLLNEIEKIEKGALLYLSSDFANPTGKSLSLEERNKLIEIATKNGWYIFDDATYRELNFNEKSTSLYGLQCENVIHAMSFSKILSPSLRIGFIFMPPKLKNEFISFKSLISLNNAGYPQAIIGGWLIKNDFNTSNHLDKLYKRLKSNAEITKKYSIDFNGGFFCEYKIQHALPDYSWCEKLLLEESIAICPMQMFSDSDKNKNSVRLSIANIDASDLEYILKKLNKFI
jgi:2-aminoadipate transaminase